MGLSRRAYAKHRKERGLTGQSEAAVRKAINAGRITLEQDGTIDPARADAQWATGTDPNMQRSEEAVAQGVAAAKETLEKDEQRPVPQAAIDAVNGAVSEATGGADPMEGGPSHGMTLAKARAAKMAIDAQAANVRLKRMKGELVDRKAATAHVFDLARKERDAWLQLPARKGAEMAAELEVDGHAMERLLDRVIREHLEELAEIKIELGGDG